MSESYPIRGELFHLMCSRIIGNGKSRVTYSSEVLPNSVIKIEDSCDNFQNVVEWESWKQLKGTEYGKWLAPCEWISHSGSVLIMAKTTPATRFPDKMPSFLDDFKHSNFGMYKGKLVCHDYGLCLIKADNLRMVLKKTKWHEK